MTNEAPKRIWANIYGDTWEQKPHSDTVEYVRADHLKAAEAERDEEIRISNERGNHIEFVLLPQLSDAEVRLAEAVELLGQCRLVFAGIISPVAATYRLDTFLGGIHEAKIKGETDASRT